MPTPIRPATPADIGSIATTLAKSFHDDPVKLHLLGGKSVPQAKVEPFFTTFQKIQLPHGHVYTTKARPRGSATRGSQLLPLPPLLS